MRTFAVVTLALILSGCIVGDRPHSNATPAPAADSPFTATYFLKSGYRLDTSAPSKDSADRVSSNPIVNGFANEDFRAFQSGATAVQWNVTSARLIVYYEVDGPTVDPFPNSTDPAHGRALVFWLGSRQVYPNTVSTYGDSVLRPGQVYRAEAAFALPAAGWIVPAGEALQILVATLAVNHPSYDLRFLVDSVQTPSRLELVGLETHLGLPATLYPVSKSYVIPGNAGLFTGATANAVDSKVRVAVPVDATDGYLEVAVRWQSNAGGKSDLDFTLFAPDGRVAMLSTTPYQNETVRLFQPHLAQFGLGAYTAEIDAYSGANTRFLVVVSYDHAHPA